MKTKKIRGHKRRWHDIDQWVEYHKNLSLDYLKEYQRDYAKIRAHPWSGISLTNSQTPEPKGLTKTKILNGLIEIYNSWKIELDELDEKYYLKIWLFEPRFSSSQVVCAGERGIRTRGPKILNHKLNIIPKSTAFEISNLGFMAFPAGIYNKIVDGNQTFQQYYPI